MQGFPKLGELIAAANNRREEWVWDGVIPAHNLTLLAAFMKKGKTTLLTGLVNGWLKTGSYCSRGVGGVRKVLYLAPEEGDTLVKRFARLKFSDVDEQALVVVPRGHPSWEMLVRRYRMREWPQVVKELKEEGFDLVVLDGLHTMLQMFEPQAKEDNEGVTQLMANFVMPFTACMTVIASLHTKKAGGDPRIHIPPEEMIRGASAWMSLPDQILVMEHLRKEDMKRFHAFGRYSETSTAQGMVIKYNEVTHDYQSVGVDEEGGGDPTDVTEEVKEEARLTTIVLEYVRAAGAGGMSLADLEKKVTIRSSRLKLLIDNLQSMGVLRAEVRKNPRGGRPSTWVFWVGSDEKEESQNDEA